MKTIYCRPATIEDLPILYKFEQGIIEAERPYDETLRDGNINYYDIKALIESPKAEVVVAVFEGEIIGSAYIDIRKAKPYFKHEYFGHLGFMFVKPEFRGKGVNKSIIEAIKQWAKGKSIHELRLDVYSENHSAVRAYEKAGFKKNLINMRIEI